MVLLLEKMYHFHGYLQDLTDARMKTYMFLLSPVQFLGVGVFYLFFVLKLGPNLMKHRKPMNLRGVLILYNLSQVLLNGWLFLGILNEWPRMNIWCSNAESSSLNERNLHYFGLLSKYLDLLDTVFIVLRKKNNQLSFLHVHHHIATLLGGWISCKFFPGGHVFYVGLPNTLIHTIMYFYYFITIVAPNNTNSFWWKKHITQLQIAQHCFIFFAFFLALINPDCTYPKVPIMLFLPNVVLMIVLFSNFYYKAYMKSPTKSN